MSELYQLRREAAQLRMQIPSENTHEAFLDAWVTEQREMRRRALERLEQLEAAIAAGRTASTGDASRRSATPGTVPVPTTPGVVPVDGRVPRSSAAGGTAQGSV